MSSFFHQAQNFVFNGTIVNADKDVKKSSTKDNRLECLVNNIAVGAMHNSDERCDAPKCHAETRVAVQREIISWITGGEKDDEPKKVCWMSGPAGTGKTAIAGSIADLCKEQGLIAASFFFSSFSGSRERCSKRRLISTIAYQLLLHDGLRGVSDHIISAVERNPVVFQLCLEDQLEQLVIRPLQEAIAQGADVAHWPKVIIIDGLDEVEPDQQGVLRPSEAQRLKDEAHTQILSTLMRAAKDTTFPFRILVVSRPEKAIRRFFSSNAIRDLTREVFLDEKYNPDADIELFLRSKFTEIRRSFDIPSTWPQDGVIRQLVDNASGQFIYAATVIRYVSDATNPPQFQLDQVLNLQTAAMEEESPLATLHALYTRILNSSPNSGLVLRWLRVIGGGTHGLPAWFWRNFLEASPGEAGFILSNLTSLMSIPPPDDRISPYRFYHKSLMDFVYGVLPWPLHDDSLIQLVSDRLTQILKDKGLPNSASRVDRDVFLKDLIRSSIFTRFVPPTPKVRFFKGGYVDHSHTFLWTPNLKDDLLSCDADWWIRILLSHHDRRSRVEYASIANGIWSITSEILSGFFWEVHVHCRWYRCLPICNHWRSAILDVCRKHGWGVPGRWSLLLNRFTKWTWTPFTEVHSERVMDPYFIFPCGRDFQPPPEITVRIPREVESQDGQLSKVPGAAVFPLT
ncbi:hypothetical protein NMY22_g15579 [Coprinellus aureogranulatus]|nr:hypothetical protein NMY22_g15579 [Coprinellus aureogranulatus]